MKVCSKEMIGRALDGIEARHGCRVLFAVESGSRAGRERGDSPRRTATMTYAVFTSGRSSGICS